MGQQKLRKVRCTNTNLKKVPTLTEPVQSLPGPYNSYPKVARNQPKPRTDVINRYLQSYPIPQILSRNFERPKAAQPLPLKYGKARNRAVSVGSSIIARSLPTYSEFELNTYTKTKLAANKGNKIENQPKSKELGTKKITKGNSNKDYEYLPKKLQYHQRTDQKIIVTAKKVPNVKPAVLQSESTQSKVNRNVELKKRVLDNKPKIVPAKFNSSDVNQAQTNILLPEPSINSKNKQKKLRKVPETILYEQKKETVDIDYPERIGFWEQWLVDHTDICHSLSKLPGELRSILKRRMNYSQIKKLDEDSLQHITEGKGPADECLCNLLSTDTKERGIKGSIRRAFASISGNKKRGGGGQKSADIPLSFTQGGKGGIYSTKEVLKRKSPCGKCGCDKGHVVLKHSYANIRITSPDLSTLCPCPDDCFPDKNKYNGNIKVTVERMAINSDDSELSLHKRTQQLPIPEPTMIAAMNESVGDLSEKSEWSSGV